MQLATYHSVIPDSAPGTAPDWIHLVPAGTFKGADGRGPYTLADPAAVIAASMALPNRPVDENHATDLAGPTGQPSPARGWIVEMQARPDGLWGRVEWTGTGQQMMADKQYRCISPVFTTDAKGAIKVVLRAALTNTPNLTQLTTLNSQEPPMDLTQFRQALGLPETADEAAVLAAVRANVQAVSTHATQLGTLAEAIGAPKDATHVVVLAAAKTLRTTTAPLDQVVQLQTQITTMQQERATERATAFIDAAIKDGKPIGGVRTQFIAQHIANPVQTEEMVNGMVSLHAGGLGNRPKKQDDEDGLTDEDMMLCRHMGTDPKALAAHKKKMAADAASARVAYDGGRA